MTEIAKQRLRLWIHEDHRGILRTGFRVKRTLYAEESDFQRIDIVETEGFGRMLFNDGAVMVSERDEFIYHEMIAHVPCFVKSDVKRALVIGGGDGGTVRELLRHPTIEYCRLVEIDPKVVEGCREHLPQTAAALDDPRVQVCIEDGVEYVAATADRFDLIVVDSSDPIGPAIPLFGPEFYGNVERILADDGIVISQAESPYYEMDAQQSLLRVLREQFGRVHLYNYCNLTYPGGLWSFSWASKGDLCPLGGFDPRRVRSAGIDFRYYSLEMHRAAFALPAFQAEALRDLLTPFAPMGR